MRRLLFNRSVPALLISHSQRFRSVFLESLYSIKGPHVWRLSQALAMLYAESTNEPQNLIGHRLERGLTFGAVFTKKKDSLKSFEFQVSQCEGIFWYYNPKWVKVCRCFLYNILKTRRGSSRWTTERTFLLFIMHIWNFSAFSPQKASLSGPAASEAQKLATEEAEHTDSYIGAMGFHVYWSQKEERKMSIVSWHAELVMYNVFSSYFWITTKREII